MISTGALRSIYAVLPMAVVPLAFADPLILMQAILVLVGSVTALPAPVAVPMIALSTLPIAVIAAVAIGRRGDVW